MFFLLLIPIKLQDLCPVTESFLLSVCSSFKVFIVIFKLFMKLSMPLRGCIHFPLPPLFFVFVIRTDPFVHCFIYLPSTDTLSLRRPDATPLIFPAFTKQSRLATPCHSRFNSRSWCRVLGLTRIPSRHATLRFLFPPHLLTYICKFLFEYPSIPHPGHTQYDFFLSFLLLCHLLCE